MKISVGGAYERSIYNFDSACGSGCSLRGGLARIAPELRVGAALSRIFAYGVVAPGVAIQRFRARAMGMTETEIDLGLALGGGVGAQVRVWRGLTVGAEAGADLAFLRAETDDPETSFSVHTLDLKLLVAWYF